jgi:hypothetical protein
VWCPDFKSQSYKKLETQKESQVNCPESNPGSKSSLETASPGSQFTVPFYQSFSFLKEIRFLFLKLTSKINVFRRTVTAIYYIMEKKILTRKYVQQSHKHY